MRPLALSFWRGETVFSCPFGNSLSRPSPLANTTNSVAQANNAGLGMPSSCAAYKPIMAPAKEAKKPRHSSPPVSLFWYLQTEACSRPIALACI